MSGIQQFDFSVDLLQSLIWQYEPAASIQKLMADKQAWYNENQTGFWTDWFRDVFNLLTANDFGLSVWSIILDQPIIINPPPDPPGVPIFGFDSEPPHVNFDRGFFSNYGAAIGLTTEEKRIILRLKYFRCISRAAIPEINRFFRVLFAPYGKVYVLDGLNMSIRVVFKYNPGNKFLYALKKFDLVPRGDGVKNSYIVVNDNLWGFDEYHKNFDRGYFYDQ